MPNLEDFGTTAQGLTVPRAADFVKIGFDYIEDQTGETVTAAERALTDRRTDSLFIGLFAYALDNLFQTLLQVNAKFSRTNADGMQADDIAGITGTVRDGATASTVTVTVTTAAGSVYGDRTVVVQGGGDDGLAEWINTDPITIPAGGSVDAPFECSVPGVVAATAGTITTVLRSPVPVPTVTNAAAAVQGADREIDGALLRRSVDELGANANGYSGGMRAAVLKVDGITDAVVVSNNTAVAATVDGIALGPNQSNYIVYPSTTDTDILSALAGAIWRSRPAGMPLLGAESATVTDEGGHAQTVYWDWGTTVSLDVAATVTLAPGYTVADVSTTATTAITDYFATLGMGDTVYVLALGCAILDTVPGVVGVSFTFDDGGGPAAGDYATAINEVPQLGTVTVS